MGLLRAAAGAAGGVMADQWKEYFYCDSIEKEILVRKGEKRTTKRSANRKGNDNIISNGSVIAVADGQCMLIVEQGKVTELCAEPGEFIYDSSTEPSLFSGDLSKTIPEVFKNIGKRFTFGGEAPKDQRVYYVNTKELMGNKYGTPSPVPFRVVDKNIGLDMDIDIKCFGEYSYRITNPILFYSNVSNNVPDVYEREEIDSQLKTEVLNALQPAFARISEMGIRYSALPGHTMELSEALNDILSKKWGELRGIEIISFGISSVTAKEEDENMIKELQRSAVLSNSRMAAGHLVGAQAAAMEAAASNETAGPAMAFMGMGMAGAAGGMNTESLFKQAANDEAAAQARMAASAPAPLQNRWNCSCGTTPSGNFCPECGSPKPTAVVGWTCSKCGGINKGKFCAECGTPKPVGVPQYRCDKCGWEPDDTSSLPKFCPECGDPFDDGDIKM